MKCSDFIVKYNNLKNYFHAFSWFLPADVCMLNGECR